MLRYDSYLINSGHILVPERAKSVSVLQLVQITVCLGNGGLKTVTAVATIFKKLDTDNA